MGKANRPLVVRIKPGEDPKEATRRALASPNAGKRNHSRILVRVVSK